MHTIIFDIETKKEFSEVGGRDNIAQLGVSVIGVYSSDDGRYLAFEEHEIPSFFEMIKTARLSVGFNIKWFDIPVLQPYASFNLFSLPLIDMMDDVIKGVGFRVSLDNLARTTLGISKSADGLQALRWYREGKIEEIKSYCLQDVKVTKELYDFGRAKGYVKYTARDIGSEVSIPVGWGRESVFAVREVLNEAFRKRRTVEIDYAMALPEKGNSNRSLRFIDVYALNGDIVEAYCHLRKGRRIFKINQILSARLTDQEYHIIDDVQHALF